MIPRIKAHRLPIVARELTISSRKDGARVPWRPFDEQEELWRLLGKHRALLVAKARKIGISTACELFDLLWTHNADVAGNRVRCVFAIDTDTKAMEHVEQFADFAEQLEMPVKVKRSAPYTVLFPGGSKIECITAGSIDPKRGGTIHRWHWTELPYWAHPEHAYQAMRSACADDVLIVGETTMETEAFTQALWYGHRRDEETGKTVAVGPEYKRHFWRVEDHESYRLEDATPVGTDANVTVHRALDGRGVEFTDDEWQEAEKEGFNDREAAAWWLKHALPNLCQGNRLKLMHDYPQTEQHLFAAGAGRVIRVTPKIAMPCAAVDVLGGRGDHWTLEIYHPPDGAELDEKMLAAMDPIETRNELDEIQEARPVTPEDIACASDQLLISVDTSRGIGKTRSVVLVVDKRDARICAAFAHANCKPDDAARIAMAAQQYYSRPRVTPLALIEDNGIGGATCDKADELGLAYDPVTQEEDSAEQCLTEAATAIEAGATEGPPELAEECDSLRRVVSKTFRVTYVGKKDVLMTYGMALVRRRQDGFELEAPRVPFEDKRVSLAERLAEDAAMESHRPRWGW